ncbi:MAG: 6-carboxytetrahydropterin synthase [Saprospiraceae bacterium]|nr:6-carboxytetrahydropterin synthase [Saprospiraceae bacterium]
MYELTVSDHVMIAHSLPDPFFGPAQHVHGATFVVHAGFSTTLLTDEQVVLDIGKAITILKEVLSTLNYKNLDDLPQFAGKLTTTEALAAHIHTLISARVRSFFIGTLKVTLEESPVARASYTASVEP